MPDTKWRALISTEGHTKNLWLNVIIIILRMWGKIIKFEFAVITFHPCTCQHFDNTGVIPISQNVLLTELIN